MSHTRQWHPPPPPVVAGEDEEVAETVHRLERLTVASCEADAAAAMGGAPHVERQQHVGTLVRAAEGNWRS
jgi:hypothetical protein